MNYKLMNGDVIEMQKEIEEQSVDLIIADPPYFNTDKDKIKNRMSGFNLDKYLEWSDLWIKGSSKILKDNGSFYLFSGHIAFELYGICKKYLTFRNHISWIKPNRIITTPQLKNWFLKTEIILFFTKCESYTWNPIVKRYGIKNSCNYQIINNITLQMSEGVEHPSQKPLLLIEKIIRASSNPGDTIFSPFLGSGTDAVCCQKLGRNFIGIDIDEKYIEMTRGRLGEIIIKSEDERKGFFF